MTPSFAPRLLRVEQVAELLGIKKETVYLWLAQRRLPKVSLGRAVRVPARAIEDLIAANTTPARGERP
jgi:excisionase family DNA binding protein